MPDLADRARTLLDLHTAPEILVLANVWDVVSARVVAGDRRRAGARHRQPLDRRDASATRTARTSRSTCTWTWSAGSPRPWTCR